MRIYEILTELTFGGSRCTKDCSGHKAGYRWARRKGVAACNSHSNSFNNGCAIAAKVPPGSKIHPKVRDERGRFYPHPRIR